VVAEELDIGTVILDTTGGLALEVVLTAERSEAPVLGDNDLLATGKLVLRAAEGLEGKSTVCRNNQLAAAILGFGRKSRTKNG
jgi:hypothetical protein